MIDIQFIADLELLRESVDLECKLAAGRGGSRGVYCLAGTDLPTREAMFEDGSEHSGFASAHWPSSSAHWAGDWVRKDCSWPPFCPSLSAPSEAPGEPIFAQPVAPSFGLATSIARGCFIDPSPSALSGRDTSAGWFPGLRPGLSPFAPLGHAAGSAVGDGRSQIERRLSPTVAERLYPAGPVGLRAPERRLNS
jgi:hypothetical protein